MSFLRFVHAICHTLVLFWHLQSKLCAQHSACIRRKRTMAPSTLQSPLSVQSVHDCKKFGECQICIAVARSRILSEIWIDIWAQSALRRCISGNLLAITLCKEPRLNRNSFGLSSWLIELMSRRFKITHLFDVSPKLFLKITSTAKLTDKGARMALSPHLVYNCAWPWGLWSPTEIETFRSVV